VTVLLMPTTLLWALNLFLKFEPRLISCKDASKDDQKSACCQLLYHLSRAYVYYLILVIFCLNSSPYRLWKDVNTGACQIRKESPLVFLGGGHLVLLLL